MVQQQNSSTLYYNRNGNAKKVLLLFHGFGQDHSAFKSLVESLAGVYTCYAFDLYFHGRSDWAKGEIPLEKQEWKKTIDIFLNENQIEEFSVLGFSLGGKFALATLEAFPEKTKEMFLIAPDGIHTGFWYSLATYPLLFRRLFKSMITRPRRFFLIAEILSRTGLMNKSVLRFAEHQMESVEKRSRVYNAWVVFRHLSFDMKKVGALINKFEISVTVLVGKYDKIIRPENMTRLLKYLKHYKLEIAKTGHNHLLNDKVLQSLILSANRGQNENQR